MKEKSLNTNLKNKQEKGCMKTKKINVFSNLIRKILVLSEMIKWICLKNRKKYNDTAG